MKNINRKEFLEDLCKEFVLAKESYFTNSTYILKTDKDNIMDDVFIEFIPAGKYFFTIYVQFIIEDLENERKMIYYIKEYFTKNKIDKKIVLHFTGYTGEQDIFLNFKNIRYEE